MNEFETVWAALPEATRSWLIDHNGEPVPEAVVQQLIDAAGGTAPDWLDPTGEDGPVLVDAVVDWIEGRANDE